MNLKGLERFLIGFERFSKILIGFELFCQVLKDCCLNVFKGLEKFGEVWRI